MTESQKAFEQYAKDFAYDITPCDPLWALYMGQVYKSEETDQLYKGWCAGIEWKNTLDKMQ